VANYSNITANGRSISDIIQDYDNRTNSADFFSGYYSGEKVRLVNGVWTDVNNYSAVRFATYNSNYHPFNYVTNINEFFHNSYDSSANKGYIPNGLAPILNNRYSVAANKTITLKFKGTGNLLDNGTLYWYEGDSLVKTFSCPSSIIVGIQGSGGGGAGGGGWYTGKISYGGGCGPLCYFHIEMPYTRTAETNVLQVVLGSGGSGGGRWNSGSNGSSTTIKFWNNDWVTVASVEGGHGGLITDNNVVYAPSDEPAISRVTFYQSINSSIYGNIGMGRITVVPNGRYYYAPNAGTFAYIPGNYTNGAMNDAFVQYFRTTPRISSGSNSYGYISGSYGQDYTYNQKWTTIARVYNEWHCGWSSISGAGGGITDGSDGKAGGCGAGGGAGAPATNIFDGGGGSGGSGGPAGIKIYW